MESQTKNRFDTPGRKTYVIVFACVAFEIALLSLLSWKYGARHLNSDDSAELILARLLSRECGFLSRNWYYSTELRVLNTQIITSLLFRLTDSFRLVRTLTTAIHLILLEISYLFLCRSSGQGNRLILFAPLLVWPFSSYYYNIVLHGLYYIPHLMILFLSLGLMLRLSGKPNGKPRFISGLTVLAALSFAACLGGIRMMVICFFPILAASVLMMRERPRMVPASITAFLAAAAGCFVNARILPSVYSYWAWDSTRLAAPSFGKSIRILSSVYLVLGGELPEKRFSVRTVILVLALLMCLALIFLSAKLLRNFRSLSGDTRFLLLVFAASFLVTFCASAFTTQSWSNRYMIMPAIGFVAILSASLELPRFSKKWKTALFSVIALSLLLSGTAQLFSYAKNSRTKEQQGAFDAVLASGIEFGFGDWDASDVLTELSDGRIHLCKIQDYENLTPWYWLMEKDYRKYGEDRPVFLILDNERLNAYHGGVSHVVGEWEVSDLTYLDRGTVLYSDKFYTVRSFDSFETLKEAAGSSW